MRGAHLRKAAWHARERGRRLGSGTRFCAGPGGVCLAAAALLGACASGGGDSGGAYGSSGCHSLPAPGVGVRYERFERRPTVQDTPSAILHRASEFLSQAGMTVQAISVSEIRAFRGRDMVVAVATSSPREEGVETLVCGAWEVREDPLSRPNDPLPPGTGTRTEGMQVKSPVPRSAAELNLLRGLVARIEDVSASDPPEPQGLPRPSL